MAGKRQKAKGKSKSKSEGKSKGKSKAIDQSLRPSGFTPAFGRAVAASRLA
jgi:hypothetical protein